MDKKKYLNLKNKYQKGTLSNGLKYICSPNPLHNSCSIVFFMRVGSRNESPQDYGLAHFLEHMLFKGNRTYPDYRKLNQKIDLLHASTNASTSKNYTNYYLKLPSKNLVAGLELLREMVFYSNLKTVEIDKEKKVVIEEINKTIDDSSDYAGDLLDKSMFQGHPLSHFVLGSKSIINGLTRKQLMKFYKKYYVINNCVVSLSGNIPKNIETYLSQIFKDEKPTHLKLQFTEFIYPNLKPVILHKKRKQEQIAIVLGFPSFNEYHPDKYVLDIITNILYGNMTSRLWLKLRDNNPIVYGVEIYMELLEEGGYVSINLGLSKNNLEKALKILYVELTKLKKVLVPKSELSIVKNKMIEDLKEEDDDNLDIAKYYGEKYLLESDLTTFSELEKIYKKISADKIRKISHELFDFKKVTLVEVGDVSEAKLKKMVQEIFI